MAGKISNLTELTDPASGDELPIVDSSATETKKVTYSNLNSLPSGTQGDVLYHNGTDWVVLSAGTSGQFLQTQGTGANPVWGVPTPSVEMEAGESISKGEIIAMKHFGVVTLLSITQNGNYFTIDENQKYCHQEFKGTDIGNVFNRIKFYLGHTGGSYQDLEVNLRKASDGTVLWTTSINTANITDAGEEFVYDIGSYIQSQDVILEFFYDRSLASDESVYVYYNSVNPYAATDAQLAPWDGTNGQTGDDLDVELVDAINDDLLGLSEADNATLIDQTIGVALESGGVHGNVSVAQTGSVTVSGWGLTVGKIYYLQDTPGQIGTSAGTNKQIIGVAETSETLALISLR